MKVLKGGAEVFVSFDIRDLVCFTVAEARHGLVETHWRGGINGRLGQGFRDGPYVGVLAFSWNRNLLRPWTLNEEQNVARRVERVVRDTCNIFSTNFILYPALHP